MKFLTTFLIALTLGLPAGAQNIPNGSVVNSKIGFNITNYAQNGEFRFWQRQVPGTLTNRQDATYGPDRMYILNSGGAVNMQSARVDGTTITSSPTSYAGQFRQADATPRQFGPAQWLESVRVMPLRGKQVQFAFWARTDSTEITTIRVCIMQWGSTVDSPTRDVVSSWAATPTFVANVTCANTPADITINGTFAQYTVSATLNGTFNNLGWFIWTPNAEAQNDDLYLSQVQLVQGNAVVAWRQLALDYEQELVQLQRFYSKSYAVDTAPATSVSYFVIGGMSANGNFTSNTFVYPVPARITPSCTGYSINGTAGATCWTGGGWATSNGNTNAQFVCGPTTLVTAVSNSSGSPIACGGHYTADAEF